MYVYVLEMCHQPDGTDVSAFSLPFLSLTILEIEIQPIPVDGSLQFARREMSRLLLPGSV